MIRKRIIRDSAALNIFTNEGRYTKGTKEDKKILWFNPKA